VAKGEGGAAKREQREMNCHRQMPLWLTWMAGWSTYELRDFSCMGNQKNATNEEVNYLEGWRAPNRAISYKTTENKELVVSNGGPLQCNLWAKT
jgi:hypothetical protein